MNTTTINQNLQVATTARQQLQSQGIEWNDPRMQSAISAERIAREEVAKFTRATMAEGFRWNR